MKIAMTGATGFAGRHALGVLLADGHWITALVRSADVKLPGATLVIGDLSSRAALDRLTEGADAVVHLAGCLSAPRPAQYFTTNAEGARRLADAAARNGVRRFIHVSSLAAREPALSPYAASKLAGEGMVMTLAPQALVLRPPAVYGPGDKAMLPLFRELTKRVALIPGRREARFSLLYVEDLARIIAEAVDSTARGIRELGDGHIYRWNDVLQIAQTAGGQNIRAFFLPKPLASGVALVAGGLARVTQSAGMLNPGKVRELYHGDWVAAGENWPLTHPVAFEDGFRKTIAWYREAGWLPRPPRNGPA